MRRSGAVRWGAAVALSVAAMGSAVAQEKPSFFKSLIDRATGKSEGAADGGGEIRPKEITKTSRYASVVLDRNCPDIVQPYTLVNNLATLGAFTVKEGLPALAQRMLRGGSRGAAEETIANPARDAAKQLNWLPMAVEIEYGRRQHAEVVDDVLDRDSSRGAQYYPVADALLQDLLAKVGEKHEYDFKLFILKSAGRNAVARPGGFLYIDEGLIGDVAVRPKAQFALAHELAHVLQRHETKELQSLIIDSTPSKDDVTRLMTGVTRDPVAILAQVPIKKNLFTRHYIDQELQADSCGTKLLSRALPDAQSLAEALNAFLKDLPPPDPTDTRPSTRSEGERVLRTIEDVVETPMRRHPTSEERARNLRTIYTEVMRDNAAGR